jgi:hypothetical protein
MDTEKLAAQIVKTVENLPKRSIEEDIDSLNERISKMQPVDIFDMICIASAHDAIEDPVQSAFWKSLIYELDSIEDGTDEDVMKELDGFGIDVGKSQDEFNSFLDKLKIKYKR